MKLKLASLSLILLQACNTSLAEKWPHGALSETCAPYDGAALNIFSIAENKSQLSIFIYSGLSALPGTWPISMNATPHNSALSICQEVNGKRSCQHAQSGTLKVSASDKNGYYQVSFDAVVTAGTAPTKISGQLTASLQLPKGSRQVCG